MKRWILHADRGVVGAALVTMATLPLLEIVWRNLFRSRIPDSIIIVQHLTLWVAFLGAALAAREGKLLALATGTLLPEGRFRRSAKVYSGAVTAAISTLLAIGGIEMVRLEASFGARIADFVPVWVSMLVLPVSFALIALHTVWKAGETGRARATAASGIAVGVVLGLGPGVLEALSAWPGIFLLLVSTLFGGPIFAALGGIYILTVMAAGDSPALASLEAFTLATNPYLPAIPLFTLAGFILSEGGAPRRLLRVFRAWFGWLPGGTAVVAAVLCAFFTVFTGGSGVTILALGGLLFVALREDGYRDRFSVGLLTASGSLGLLFPPALPLIIFAVMAELPPQELFVGGIIPGCVLVAAIAGWGIREGFRSGAERPPFQGREALAAMWGAKWELALPVVVLGAYLGGIATLVEAAALAALYSLVVECFIERDLSVRQGLLRALSSCAVVVGGVLIILGMAKGLGELLVHSDVQNHLLEWTASHIESKLLFLLCLNLFLLAVGCVLDIFSATILIVPLLLPIAAQFGIHPVHLGMIFIANLELGYLTPPVGLNLFLASYRFDRPLLSVYRAALPMFAILGIGVLVITYCPILSLGLLRLFGME